MHLSDRIGYCTTCINPDCNAPRILQRPQRDCPKGLSWTDGQATKIRQRDIIKADTGLDHFKGAIEGSTVTRRLNECPNCTGHMDTLTCSSCGYQSELKTKRSEAQ